MSQVSSAGSLKDLEDRRAYSTPSLAELGSLVDLTLGEGTSDIWDMGAGRKEE